MASGQKSKLGIHLDVGHDSIGWCVTRTMPGDEKFLAIPGTGVVLFPADDCLANQRRAFRRQRRHIRATRQRIERMKSVLLAMGVMTEGELKRNLTVAPWKLAAQVLTTDKTLSWPELWAVLRWYAHNRGYDGNVLATLRSGRLPTDDEAKANDNAKDMMSKHGTSSMAETMCREMGIEPNGKNSASGVYFKGRKVSFDRSCVENEVRQILLAHKGVLNGVDDAFIRLLMASPVTEPHYLRTVKNLPFHIPNRYWGGILFGQLAPRFDNRLIGACPVTGEKLPNKATSEFLRFRFAKILANVQIGEASRKLTAEERGRIFEAAAKCGGFQKGSFKKIVDEVTGEDTTNIDALLTAPEAEKSLVLYPGLFALAKKGLDAFLDPRTLHTLANKLFRGKRMTVGDVVALIPADKQEEAKAALTKGTRKGKKKSADPLAEKLTAELPSGRAPYARSVLVKATEAILRGEEPMEKGGILYRDATKEDVLKEEDIDRETNNHLIRHRVKILLRLLRDIVHDYAENNPAQVAQVTIEMARDLKDLSGLTQQDIKTDMARRVAQHQKAAQKLAEHLGIDERSISPGLIRKVRIADDMGWRCPYTGETYDIQQIVSRGDHEPGIVDKDHILPRSQRATDSLDSLALTFKSVNELKGARSGLQFIRECAGQRVAIPGGKNKNAVKNAVILSEAKYKELVKALKEFGHPDDKARQRRRKQNFLRLDPKDAGMTEGLLTRTSYITTLATKAIRGFFANCGRMPRIISVPGRVTAELRMQWNLLGLLAESDPRILNEKGQLRLKQEIRGITHMHHAVDAITLGLAAAYLHGNEIIQIGDIWAMMCKRRVTAEEKRLLASTGVFHFTAQNEPRLIELPPSQRREISAALAEQRVVVHQPQERAGLKADLLTWGIDKIEGDRVWLRQWTRDEKTGARKLKYKEKKKTSIAFGLNPKCGKGKLKNIKGVIVQEANFGVALVGEPKVIKHRHVWKQIGELKQENDGKVPKILRRNGLIRYDDHGGARGGLWRVASIKDKAVGIKLDLVRPYAIEVENTVDYAWNDAGLKAMIRNGLSVVETNYTGVASCPITSSTSRQTGSRSR